MQSASGSIRLLEEQLMSKYRGLDAAKEGQMEARERLLSEMEEKARTRVDNAGGYICVCVRVYVCVCERWRRRQEQGWTMKERERVCVHVRERES